MKRRTVWNCNSGNRGGGEIAPDNFKEARFLWSLPHLRNLAGWSFSRFFPLIFFPRNKSPRRMRARSKNWSSRSSSMTQWELGLTWISPTSTGSIVSVLVSLKFCNKICSAPLIKNLTCASWSVSQILLYIIRGRPPYLNIILLSRSCKSVIILGASAATKSTV